MDAPLKNLHEKKLDDFLREVEAMGGTPQIYRQVMDYVVHRRQVEADHLKGLAPNASVAAEHLFYRGLLEKTGPGKSPVFSLPAAPSLKQRQSVARAALA